MNDVIFASIIAVIFYALGILMGIACYIKFKKKNPVVTLFVSKVPNDGFYSVGIKVHYSYDELEKLKNGIVDIMMVDDVKQVRKWEKDS